MWTNRIHHSWRHTNGSVSKWGTEVVSHHGGKHNQSTILGFRCFNHTPPKKTHWLPPHTKLRERPHSIWCSQGWVTAPSRVEFAETVATVAPRNFGGGRSDSGRSVGKKHLGFSMVFIHLVTRKVFCVFFLGVRNGIRHDLVAMVFSIGGIIPGWP